MIAALILFIALSVFFFTFAERDEYAYFAIILGVPAIVWLISWVLVQ